MRWLIFILIFFAFFQVSVLPLNFDLIILIILAFVTGSFSRRLLLIGFITGIFLDFLSLTPLGTQAAGVLIVLMIVYLSRFLFSGHSMTLGIVIVAVSLMTFRVVTGLLLRLPLNLPDFSLIPELIFAVLCYMVFQRAGNFFDNQEKMRQLSFFKA